MEKIYKSKIAIVLSSLIFLYTILGFVFLPYLIQKNFSKTLSETINTNGYLEKVYINPYTFEVELTNLLIQDKKNINLLYFNKFSFDFEFTSLFSDTLLIKYIYLNNLKTNIILDKNKITNFQYILDVLNKNKSENISTNEVKISKTQLPVIKINNINLRNNRIVIVDNSKSTPFKIETKMFDIDIQNLSTLKNSDASIKTKIDITDTLLLTLNSKLSLNPISTNGDLRLDNISINKIYDYIKDDVDFDLSGDKVDISLKYDAIIGDNAIRANILDLHTFVKDLKFKNTELAISLNQLTNKIDKIDIQKENNLSTINLNGKFISKDIGVKKSKNFELSLNNTDTSFDYNLSLENDKIDLIVNNTNIVVNNTKFKNKEFKAKLNRLTNKINTINIKKDKEHLEIKLDGKLTSKSLQLNTNRTKDFKLTLNNTDTSLDYNLSIKDDKITTYIKNTKVVLKDTRYETKDLKLKLSNLSNKIEQIVVNKDGNRSIDLEVNHISINEKNISFTDLTKKVPINLNIKDIKANIDRFTLDKTKPINFALSLDTPQKGKVITKGNISLEPLKANLKLETKEIVFSPYLPYIKEFANVDIKSGELNSVFDIKITKLKDKIEPNIKGKISLNDLDIFHSLTNKRVFSLKQFKVDELSYKKDDINIKNILLDSAYTKFSIAQDKTTNIDNIVPKTTNDVNSTKKEKSNLKYFVENFDLKNSKIDFSDFSLPLNFDTKIHSLAANIKAISSSDINTKLTLNGMVDKYGIAKIDGVLNTADFKKRSDIKVNFENLDLISVSPYSGKFIGNKISSGKLWLDLAYKIKDSNLSSTNNIKIKDLELGEKVDSNESINLPIGLAVALLEDSDGFIDVDVPVSGDIDNPEFHLGGAIWGAVGNVITNIITAPFRFLGSLFGSDTDGLGEIDFDYGTFKLLAPQIEKLDKLLIALDKKQKLSLKLNPIYDEINDKKALQEMKFLILTNKKEKNKIIKDMFIKQFTLKKYEKLLVDSKDKDINDMMSKILIPMMEVTKQELEYLSQSRVKSIQTYLISKELNSSRVILNDEVDFIDDINSTKKRVTLNLDVEIK